MVLEKLKSLQKNLKCIIDEINEKLTEETNTCCLINNLLKEKDKKEKEVNSIKDLYNILKKKLVALKKDAILTDDRTVFYIYNTLEETVIFLICDDLTIKISNLQETLLTIDSKEYLKDINETYLMIDGYLFDNLQIEIKDEDLTIKYFPNISIMYNSDIKNEKLKIETYKLKSDQSILHLDEPSDWIVCPDSTCTMNNSCNDFNNYFDNNCNQNAKYDINLNYNEKTCTKDQETCNDYIASSNVRIDRHEYLNCNTSTNCCC